MVARNDGTQTAIEYATSDSSIRRDGLPVCLLPFSPPFALASAAQAEPRELTLANGLRLVVKEDHRAPTVVQQVWYRAGSMDESPGTTGVAHVLEHMMFKGTRRVGPEEFSRLVAGAGGRDNAFTIDRLHRLSRAGPSRPAAAR